MIPTSEHASSASDFLKRSVTSPWNFSERNLAASRRNDSAAVRFINPVFGLGFWFSLLVGSRLRFCLAAFVGCSCLLARARPCNALPSGFQLAKAVDGTLALGWVG